MHQVLLHQRDEVEEVAGEGLGSPHTGQRAENGRVKLGQHLAHDHRFLQAVELQALGVRPPLAPQAQAEAVERRDPRLAVVVLQACVDPARELPGSAGGERQDEDLAAIGRAGSNGLFVQIDEQMCFAGARSGEDTQRAVDIPYVEWQGLPWSGGRATRLCGDVPYEFSPPC